MTAIRSINVPQPANGGQKRQRKHRLALDAAVDHLMAFLGRVYEWMARNEARIKKVYFVPDGSTFFLYVVATSAAYDFELSDSLCDLVIELSDAGFDPFGHVIPDGTSDELAAFFDPNKAFVLAGR